MPIPDGPFFDSPCRSSHDTKSAVAARAAAIDYLDWLTETEARLRCGKSAEWLRARFPAWVTAGHARRDAQARRLYRQLVVPKHSTECRGRETRRRADRTAQ